MKRCPVCATILSQPVIYRVREMMFGYPEWFDYAECHRCHSLSLQNPPLDWSRYYPQNYYSLQTVPTTPLKRWLRQQRDLSLLGRANLLGKILSYRWFDEAIAALKGLELRPTTRILDVGCGQGQLLRWLAQQGFTNLTGIDPHLSEACHTPQLQLQSARLAETIGQWEVIMFHHTLEHMTEVKAILADAFAKLLPGGRCLVRIPTVTSWAKANFHTCWIQWDAPRHQVIFSREGFESMIQNLGFTIQNQSDESTAFQFWGSEQYRCGIPLMDPCSYFVNPAASLFSSRHIRDFRQQAHRLNQIRQGDAVAYCLVKA